MSDFNKGTLADEKEEVSQVEHYTDASAHNVEDLEADSEKKKRLTKSILRKLDTRMLPMLALLFLFSFLDRCVLSGLQTHTAAFDTQPEPTSATQRSSVCRRI